MTSTQPSPRRASLLGRAAAGLAKGLAERRAGRQARPAPDGPVLTPLATVPALERFAALCGKPASAAQLTAALPVANGELAAQFVPLALARLELAAQWRKGGPGTLLPADLPALVRLDAGGMVIVTGLAEAEVRLIDAAGEQRMAMAALVPLAGGEVLVAGHIDPVNGMVDEEERALLQRNPWLWLAGLYLGEKRRLGQMLVAAALVNLCALTIPLYMRAIYDRVVPNLALESLGALSVGMVLALAFELALRKIKSAEVDAVGLRIAQVVQHRAASAVLHARAHDSGAEGSVGAMLMALRDVENLALLVPQVLVTFAIDLPSFFVFVGVIALIGGWTLAGPVLGAVVLMVVGLIANYALKLASRRQSRLAQARNNLLVELTEGWSTIKANGAEGRFIGRWDVIADHTALATRQQRHWNELPGLAAGLIAQGVTVLVVVIAVLQISQGMMTSGAMVAVIMLSGRAMAPVSTAIATIARLFQSLSQFEGLARILKAEPERRLSDPAIAPARLTGRIAIEGLGHQWPGGAACLKDIALTIAPGERVALIGRSGSGKSTLLQLIAGLLPLAEGRYAIDGHAVSRYAAAQLRDGIAYAAQDAALFDTTIWDNILLGLPEPAPELVEAALRDSGLAAHVEHSLEGFMRKVGPRGSRLSGGQRQSLILARALIRDPRVLLLDEPTAAMDIASEQAVINGLARAAKGRTLLVATHRLALLDLVDRVIWLEDGRIIADRPRDEVVAMLRRAPMPGAGAADGAKTTQVA